MTTNQTTQTFEQKLAEAHAIADAHGPYAYGDTGNPVSRVYYEESVRLLAETMAACPYCKGAKTRARNAGRDELAIERAACSKHARDRRLNYVCSPVSETYWCS